MQKPLPVITIENLNEAPQFQLRADFPDENCWTDAIQVPVTAEIFATMRESCHVTFEKYRDALPSAAPGPLFGYYGIVWEGESQLSCLLFDGMRPVEVGFDGLFADLCRRVNAALKLPAGAHCPILPVHQPGALAPKRVRPSHFVYHYREAATAYILPYGTFLQMHWQPWLPR